MCCHRYSLCYYTLLQDQLITKPYINKSSDITEQMRTILVDWLIEVQENFALFHETLYLAVQIMDHYLEQKFVKREYLQLVGATAMLIASKFEVNIIVIYLLLTLDLDCLFIGNQSSLGGRFYLPV